MTETQSTFANVIGWLNAGFPDGVAPKDHFALLALLKRNLSEDEVVDAARRILKSANTDDPVTDQQIRDTIHTLIDKEPNPEEMRQVSARLASVGWPLAAPSR